MDNVISTLKKLDAVQTDGHFLYSSGAHGDSFFNLRVLGTQEHEDLLRNLVYRLSCKVLDSVAPISSDQCVFVGPESLGKTMARMAHEEHRRRNQMDIPWLWFKAQVTQESKSYIWGDDGGSEMVTGKTVFWLDDLFNKFSTFQRTRSMLEPFAERIVAGAIVDRGGNTARQWGINQVVSLESVNATAYSQDDCPLCESTIPLVNPKTGKTID